MAHHLTLLFETHATSVDNEHGIASGWYDAPVSATGEDQARALGERRRNDDLAVVFCSDLARALRTAEIAFGRRGIPIVRDARLRECNYGTLTRHPASEIDARRGEHVTMAFPKGESYREVVERVATWLNEVASAFNDKTVVVVGHRATHYALQHLLADVPLAAAVGATWQWQPGWRYLVPVQRLRSAARSTAVPRK